jgi:hypothetical protein
MSKDLKFTTASEYMDYEHSTNKEYTPNYWQVVRITSTEGKVLYKVFATWTGGYVEGDSWQMNSGIEEIAYKDDYVLFTGYSGSIYKCLNKEHVYRTTAYTYSVLESMIKKADLIGAKIEVVPFDTNFLELIDDTTA